ncbi:unnamed protein product [Candidula unifasciata]|uniref:FYVE-type domain-containing protein n=1 Tax=Candidula unifasciata TaxID=100452 RepID=A0A8S3ZZP7_9EUPU|nr:unnamed protein product [Candidula unifasciata]
MAKVEKKLVKSKSGYKMVTVDERITSPFTIDEPPWTPDYACSNCQNGECHIKFDFLKRKHHCRRCGQCFCDDCCNSLIELPRMCFIDPVRHCKGCAIISKRESEFFDKHLRILLDGGRFLLRSDCDIDEGDLVVTSDRACVCTLSVDHRYLEFKGDTQEQENIAVQKITSVEVTGPEQDGQGHGVTIHYTDAGGEAAWLKMDVDDTSGQRQQSMSWLAALIKAFKLMPGSQQASSSP